jgi:protein-tyrosine phosphatase
MTRVPPMDAKLYDLVGAVNFRDMGGHRGWRGKPVRWNRLYRSGAPHRLTDNDIRIIRECGIRHAYDLRSNFERAKYPSRLANVVDISYLCRDHDRSREDLHQLIKQSGATAQQAREVMLDIYRGLPIEFCDSYREILLRISEGQLPIVINCTAGKDRTGVAAALILSAVGVSRESIIEDYVATERYSAQITGVIFGKSTEEISAGIRGDFWAVLLGAEPEYLDAMYSELEAQFGSVEEYLLNELRIDGDIRERLQYQLLQNE